MKKSIYALIGIIALSFAIAFYVYPLMPERMASHWNSEGRVDGYMTKSLGLFSIPLLVLGLAALFLIIPKLDPLSVNIEKFRGYYDWFVVGVVGFLFYVYLLMVLWNLGYLFDMGRVLLPVLGALLYGVGILLGKAKRNWFIGIRTPWTLSNDAVWDETHRRGSVLFKLVGVLTALGALFKAGVLFLLVPLLGVTAYLMVFSYFEYRKVTKR